MTAFFWAVVTMSLTASVAILGVLLGRLLLKGAPKVFSYALWAVVLFRLLCPLSLPAEFSLLGLLPASPVSAEQVAPLPADPSPAVSPATPTPSPAAGGESPVPLPAEAADPSASAPSLLRSVLPALWLAGAVAMALYGLGQLHRLRRALVGALPLGDRLYWNDHIGTPFVLGLFRPRIYLPSTLSPQEAPYIIAHERHHIARGDHITRVLAFAALCLHWFNPLVWLAFVLSGRDMELSCDEAVMRQTRRDIRAEYSTSLLHFSTGRRLMPLAFGQGDVKERIENIMRYRKPSLGVIALAVVLCLALTACLSTDPPAETDPAGSQPESLTLTGYITALDPSARTLDFDQVSWLTSPEDDALLEELGINGNDLPNGFYIYDPEAEVQRYPISTQTAVQIFEITENSPWEFVETDLDTFAKELNTRTNLYTITVENGVVTALSERYVP